MGGHHREGLHLLVVGGGAGKTAVLVERIIRKIDEEKSVDIEAGWLPLLAAATERGKESRKHLRTIGKNPGSATSRDS
jgi:ubiquinone/menaquinone biosynthesis C-methylase UbiE